MHGASGWLRGCWVKGVGNVSRVSWGVGYGGIGVDLASKVFVYLDIYNIPIYACERGVRPELHSHAAIPSL